MTKAIETLMDGLIDYAGLFPPSKLAMQQAVENYAKYTRSEHAGFLSRFICPVTKLMDLTEHGAMLMPGTYATSGYREMADDLPGWSVSAIIDADLDECLDVIAEFNEHHRHEDHGLARVDAIEMRIDSPSDVDDALDLIPEEISPSFEIPKAAIFSGDPRGYVAALAGNDALAKIRCGGITPDLFPAPADIARFIHACHAADVPFKATAGLHHPVRAEQNLTYDDNPPRGVMHGFLNVFLAAALVRVAGIDEPMTVRILEETDPKAFVLTDTDAGWRDHTINLTELARVRESFATGYGSCSFTEPIDDLRHLGLL
ncbi:MAG: hypothetical protein D6692_06785 [Planctomycetota bacterium]|nr:MAG: hypothetical protein D6692_06785 [Planctomycetota bacterium]